MPKWFIADLRREDIQQVQRYTKQVNSCSTDTKREKNFQRN